MSVLTRDGTACGNGYGPSDIHIEVIHAPGMDKGLLGAIPTSICLSLFAGVTGYVVGSPYSLMTFEETASRTSSSRTYSVAIGSSSMITRSPAVKPLKPVRIAQP